MRSPVDVPCRIRTHSPEETIAFGERLSERLGPGSVVGLFGVLGSGKTCLIKGICRGLGVSEPVTSPSFIIINHYRGRLPIYHFDLYRINSAEELYELGYEEYFYGEGVCLIEWAERAGELLPEGTVEVRLRYLGGTEREVEVRGI